MKYILLAVVAASQRTILLENYTTVLFAYTRAYISFVRA